MRLLLIAPMLIASPVLADPVGTAKPICQPDAVQPVRGAPRVGVHRLDQEPPAKAVRTVLRTVDGCAKPVLVSDRLHGAPQAPAPR